MLLIRESVCVCAAVDICVHTVVWKMSLKCVFVTLRVRSKGKEGERINTENFFFWREMNLKNKFRNFFSLNELNSNEVVNFRYRRR